MIFHHNTVDIEVGVEPPNLIDVIAGSWSLCRSNNGVVKKSANPVALLAITPVVHVERVDVLKLL
jgi:hypothetical protein